MKRKKLNAGELAAADIMQKDVLVAYQGDTLKDALRLMTENHVTGLPVMNSHSKCVGVITSTDILYYDQDRADYQEDAQTSGTPYFDMESGQWDSLPNSAGTSESLAQTRIDDVMTRDIIYVSPQTPLREVAQRILHERVHRVLVLDSEFHLYGIISATDFVRLFAESESVKE